MSRSPEVPIVLDAVRYVPMSEEVENAIVFALGTNDLPTSAENLPLPIPDAEEENVRLREQVSVLASRLASAETEIGDIAEALGIDLDSAPVAGESVATVVCAVVNDMVEEGRREVRGAFHRALGWPRREAEARR